MRALLPSLIGIILGCTASVAADVAPGHRSTPLSVAPTGRVGFTLLPEAVTGIHFTNHLADRSVAENQIRMIGSGVALGDVDGDGRCDLYLCRLEGPNALYRNLGGWKFEDITAAAGVACADQYSTGATLADLDGDGDLDLLVNAMGGGTRCFFNDGRGHFTENNSGLARNFCATSMALADIDGNGTLDLYVANYRTTTIRSTGLQLLNVNGRRLFKPEDRDSYEFTPEGLVLEHAEPDAVYLNDGRGRFTPLPWTGGNFLDADGKPLARGDKDWGLSVMFRDMNGDGAPDIYVCNDFWSADAIWLNDGKGRFRALPKLALRNSSTFSMGVDFADINRDGLDDFIVLDMRSREHARRMVQRSMAGGTPVLTTIEERPQTERNTLFLNRGDGTYAEIAQLAGLQASEWSWCAAFLDVDLDGFEDLLVTTGHGFDSQDADTEAELERAPRQPGQKFGDRILRFPRLRVPAQAFRNRGDLTFAPAGDDWGFNTTGVAHGLALADLDGDGDLDVVVNNLNDGVGVYRNETGAPRVLVRLQGLSPNTRGIGAKMQLQGGPVSQSQEMISGGRYLSSDEAVRVFAAWQLTNRFQLTVTWRSGAVSVVSNVMANTMVEVKETGATRPQPAAPTPQTTRMPPLFKDVSAVLGHSHHEEPFDDFARQPLLAQRLSHTGPGVAWADLDGDGREDLLVGSGRGGEPGFFQNAGDGTFTRIKTPSPSAPPRDDQTALLAHRTESGTTVWIGMANYEAPATNAPAALVLAYANGGLTPQPPLPSQRSSTGPMSLADVDGDGDLDLFIGGAVIAGRFPEPATSRLFRNDHGQMVLTQEFTDVGLVNGAVFTDLDGDGFSDLVLACTWGPLKVFRNDHGRFNAWNWKLSGSSTFKAPLSSLNDLTGWWHGVTAADFDGDGRLDLVASNLGRNSPYQSFLPGGFRIYYGDFSGAGFVDGVEAYLDHGREVPWRDLDTLSRALPWLRQKYPSYHAFAQATLADVLDGRAAKSLNVNWSDSTVFLNRGDHFEIRALPLEAQFAPAFGLGVADFDGDGTSDIFLAQNFFPTDGDTSRYDAGRGLLLLGDGVGGFRPVPARESGLEIYGEGRGAAVADYDGDGRVDLGVGQNGAETKLYHNERARPGLRVRLQGPPQNRSGFGAVLRPVFAHGRMGAARELHAGSGWLSQDSAVSVLAGPEPVKSIFIRWPGGTTTQTEIAPGAREVSIRADAGK